MTNSVEVRILTTLGNPEAFEEALDAFLDNCGDVQGGYVFSVHRLSDEDDG